jgi:DNA-binding LacI/PurR family transcriptional regulator
MSVGLKEIAELVGVSISTVSRALRDDPRVNKRTKERIISAARNMNYLPNQAAKSLITKKTMTIGLVLPNLRSFMHDIFDGLESVCSPAGYNILLGVSDNDPTKEMRELKLLLEKRVDGLILFYVGGVFNQASIRFLNSISVPLILIDRYIPRSHFDFVVSDNRNGSRKLVEHLVSKGKEKIAFITQKEDASAIRERLDGFMDGVLKCGIKLPSKYIVNGKTLRMENGYACTRKLMKLDDPPQVIIGSTGDITLGVVKYLLEHPHLENKITVGGFDDFEFLSFLKIPVTTVAQKTYEMGKQAATILLNRLQGDRGEQRRVFLETELVER